MQSRNPITALLPFWLYILFFKFGAGLHYTLLAPLGERILPVWIVGLVIGSASLLQIIFDVPAGFILDRFGYVRVLKISTLIFLLGAIVLLFPFSTPVYLLSVFLGFIGWLFFGPGSNAYALALARHDEGGRYMSLLHVFSGAGVVCSVALLSFLINRGVPLISFVLTIILSVTLMLAIEMRPERISVHTTTHAHKHYYIRRHFLHKMLTSMNKLNPASLLLALQGLSGSILYGTLWFTVPLVLVHQNDNTILSMSLGIFDLGIVILGAFLGRLADRYNKKLLTLLGLLLFSLAGIFLGWNFGILFLILGFLATTGDEMANAALWSWLEELDKTHSEDGIINGVIALFEDVGWMIGPVAAGFLFTFVGPSYTIAIGAVPIVLVWIFAVFSLHNKSSSTNTVATSAYRPIRHRHKK